MLCSISPGPRMSASQLTHALSTWPELSEQERITKFFAALHVTRPRAAADPRSHRAADMLSAVRSGSPTAWPPLPDAPEQHALKQGSPDGSLRSSRETSSAGSHPGGSALTPTSMQLCCLLHGLHTGIIGSVASGEPGHIDGLSH